MFGFRVVHKSMKDCDTKKLKHDTVWSPHSSLVLGQARTMAKTQRRLNTTDFEKPANWKDAPAIKIPMEM